jgi:hypothetical protein
MTNSTSSFGVRSITWGLFLVQLFLAVCLPAGSLYGLSLKTITFVLFFVLFVLDLATMRYSFSHREIIFVAVVTACLCFWSLEGLFRGQGYSDQVLLQLRAIAMAISVAFLSIFAIRRGLVKAQTLIAVIIYGMFAVSAVKVVLVAASFFSNIDAIQITHSLFGEETHATPQILGLVRLDFAADSVGAFALFALLAPSVSGVRFSRMSKLFISIIVVLGSGFLTYARAIWFIYVACIFVAMIVERSWKAMALTILAALVVGACLYDVFGVVYADRFVAQAESSDMGRAEQARALMAEIKVRPILGKGMGAHHDTDTRDLKEKYSYELLWLAFLMQFGIVGEIGIFILVAASARDLLRAKHPAKPWVLLVFALWLLENCFNPHMTSSFAGATFGLFMAMFYRMRTINLSNAGGVRVGAGHHATAFARG